MDRQRTLRQPLRFAGIGLHTGAPTAVVVEPAAAGTGLRLRRSDLGPVAPIIPVAPGATAGLAYATTLSAGSDGAAEAGVSTVEHLLAALHGMGVDNALILVEGPEIPILDGSALPFVEAIEAAGLEEQAEERRRLELREPVRAERGDAWIEAVPGRELVLAYAIDFPGTPVGRQEFELAWTPRTFADQVAPARTFGFVRDLDRMREMGLIRGGSLENAVAFGPEGPLRSLRFPDEPVRHKVLDLVGDLALLGRRLRATVRAHKAGHALHALLVEALLAGA